jgi:hypothetical protein
MATRQQKGGDVAWYVKAPDAATTSRAFGYPGQPLDINSADLKRVRDYGPLDMRMIYTWHRANPEIMGEENWRRYEHGHDISWVQQEFGKSQQVNSARYYYEMSNPRVTNRFLRSDDTLDNVITHTPSSDWFRDVHVSLNKDKSKPMGDGRLMVNNVRYAQHYQ